MAAAPQFGDIVAAVRICRWIHSKCIAPENAASQMYLDFRKDIIAFGIGLEQLQKVFPTAAAYTESLDDSLDFPDHYTGFQRRPRSLELEAMELIGNFKVTLEECKKLLKRYVRFENGRSTFWDNAFWHSGTQETVESLRSRIEAHTAGIKLIIEPLQLRLITNIDENVSVILQLLRLYLGLDRPTQIPPILATLTPKFKAAILRDAPQGVDVTNPRQLPVRETVQILRIHFENSTKKSALGVHLEMEQYLNLLKAQWLVTILNQSETLKMPQSQLHRRIVGQIEQWIAKEYTREDFLSWDQLALEGMDDAAFAIWPKPKPPRIPQPTDAMAGEEHIGTMQTIPPEWAEKQTLDVFRSPDNILRFVCSQIPIGNPNAPIRTIFSLNTRHDTFIPRYTVLDSAAKKSWCIQTTSRYGNDQHIFDISSMQDAHKLQSAFTRYSVLTSRTNVKCAVTCCEEGWLARIKGVDPILGRGELQLWQWPAIHNSAQENLRAAQSSRRQSSTSADRRSYSHRSVMSIASSFKELPSSVVSVTEEGGKGVVVAATSPPPFLLAFLKQERLEKMSLSSRNSVQYIMWKIDVSNLKSVTRNNPLEITLRCKDGDNFDVQNLSTSEDKLDMWNLCALVDPLHHARKIPDIPRPKSMKCAYIVLVFTTTEESELFALYFKLVTKQRTLENMYAAQGQRIAYANEVSKLENMEEKIGVRSRQASTTSAASLPHTATRPTERPWILPPQNFNFQPISLTPPPTPDPEDNETPPDPAQSDEE